MNFCRSLFVAVALSLCFSCTAVFGREGYFDYTDGTPIAVSRIWNSVYYVLNSSSNFKLGSSSLINVKKGEATTELYFLTSYHVVRDHCRSIGVCKGLSLGQDAIFTLTDDETKISSEFGFYFSTVELFKYSRVPDLALLKVSMQTPKDNRFPKPVQLPLNCPVLRAGQKMYSVGFPKLSLRYPDEPTVTKRWSEGFYLKDYKVTGQSVPGLVEYYHGSTMDLLGGGSGGPVVDDYGQVVGLANKTASVKENGHQYNGSENPTALDWQSLVISCTLIREFIYGK